MVGNLTFSIILPVCHGGGFLLNALESLRRMDYTHDRFEVLVAGLEDDEESRRAVEAESARAPYAVKYLGTRSANRAGRLNAACSEARGRVLAFADDDCILLPDWLPKIDAALGRYRNVGVLGGSDAQGRDASAFHLALDHVLKSFVGTGGLRQKTGPRVGKYYPKLWNMAVPRDVALHVARPAEVPCIFNEALTVHEDVDLVDRVEKTGRQIVFAPEVLVMHSRDTTLGSFVRRSFVMARIARSLGVHRLPHMVLMVFAVGLAALTILTPLYQPAGAILGSVIGIYLAVLLASAIGGLVRTGKFSVFSYVPILLISLHFARGLGFLFPFRGLHR